jgi:hypothetical protein
MSNKSATVEFEEVDADLIDDDEITSEDYGFILDADGNLKSVFMPEHCMELPESVKEICKVFGIEHPNQIYEHTIH